MPFRKAFSCMLLTFEKKKIMILVGNAVLSDDIKENFFVCDLEACKGACCVEGDAGAPLEDEETAILEKIYPQVKDYLTDEGRRIIEEQGTWVIDKDGDKGTPTIGDNRECAYAIYDERGVLKCGIEQAYLDGKTDFKKTHFMPPLSNPSHEVRSV